MDKKITLKEIEEISGVPLDYVKENVARLGEAIIKDYGDKYKREIRILQNFFFVLLICRNEGEVEENELLFKTKFVGTIKFSGNIHKVAKEIGIPVYQILSIMEY